MKNITVVAVLLLFALPGRGQLPQRTVPQLVEIPSGKLRLTAYFWKPAGHGPFPAVLFVHGSGGTDPEVSAGMAITQAAEILAPIFVKHGYAFLFEFRRGHGPSRDQAPYMQDLLAAAEQRNGLQGRSDLQFKLLTTDYLEDVLAAFSVLQTLPDIDRKRIAIVGHSFGGQLALLAAERESTLRAVVAFAAASASWNRSLELRDRLLAAVRSVKAPVMLIHANNDFSTTPGHVLEKELRRIHKRPVLRIYGDVGLTPEDGHNMLYLATPLWEDDVFRFLDASVKR